MFDGNNEKSKKQKAREQAQKEAAAPLPPKKVKFDDLKSPNTEGDELYKQATQKLRDRKAERKQTAAALKAEQLTDLSSSTAQIQRNVQKDILANRGLTRKRKKTDRNPRVKKRKAFEEMEKKRKRVVREFKEGK